MKIVNSISISMMKHGSNTKAVAKELCITIGTLTKYINNGWEMIITDDGRRFSQCGKGLKSNAPVTGPMNCDKDSRHVSCIDFQMSLPINTWFSSRDYVEAFAIENNDREYLQKSAEERLRNYSKGDDPMLKREGKLYYCSSESFDTHVVGVKL